MHVTLGGFVLFLHIGVAIIAFMMAAVLHAALQTVARASDVREMRSWGAWVHRLEPLLPISALLLLGLGAWLIHLSGGAFSWKDGWVMTAVVALVVVEGLAGARLAPKSKALVKEIEQGADGTPSDNLRKLSRDAEVWHIAHVATFGFGGVVFLMAAKPSGVWSVVIVVIAAALGLLASTAQLRALPAASGAAVPGPRKVGEAV